MTNYDQGIIYEAKLKEAKKIINDLTNIGINVEAYEKEVAGIEKDVVRGISNISNNEFANSCTGTAVCFTQDSISYNYMTYIKRLEEIINTLKEQNNDYFVISNLFDTIRNSILNPKTTDINGVIDTIIDGLNTMRTSTTIDYRKEKNIVKRMYKLIYEIMKREIVYAKNTRLLDTIRSDEINSIFIADLLKEEIEEVNDDDVNNLVSNLQSKGIDSRNLLDKDLIELVAMIKDEKMLSEEQIEFEANQEELERLLGLIVTKEADYQLREKNLQETKDEYKDLKIKTRKAGLRATLNAIALAFLLTGGYVLADKIGRVKEYYTDTYTYTSETGTTTNEPGYTRGEDGSVTITELTPWQSPGFFEEEGEYKRLKYKYTIPEEYLDLHDNPEEFLDENLKGIIESSSPETESSEELPEDYGYGENKYIIVKQVKDLDKVNMARDYILFGVILSILNSGIIAGEYIYLKKNKDNSYRVLRKIKKFTNKRKNEQEKELKIKGEELKGLKEKAASTTAENNRIGRLIEAATNENGEAYSDEIFESNTAVQKQKKRSGN